MPMLADWFVQLSAKGLQQVGGALGVVKQGLDNADKAARVAGIAFAAATASVTAFTRAGFAGTAQGELFSLRIKLLSQQVAGIFVPTLDNAGRFVERLTEKFRALDGSQQGVIRRFGEASLAATTVGLALSRVNPAAGLVGGAFTFALASSDKGREAMERIAGQFEKLIPKIGDLAASLTEKLSPALERLAENSESGIDAVGTLLGIFDKLDKKFRDFGYPKQGGIVDMLTDLNRVNLLNLLTDPTKLLDVPQSLQRFGGALGGAMGKAQPGRTDVSMAGGQFEDLAGTFRRIQATALRTEGAKSPEVKAIEALTEKVEKQPEQFAIVLGNILKIFFDLLNGRIGLPVGGAAAGGAAAAAGQ